MIGKKIRLLREKKGFTQEEVAKHLHILQSTYARIENGKGNSWASYLDKICSLFDISASDLFNTDTFILNKNKGDDLNGYIIKQLSEKLIDQYEARIAEKDTVIKEKDTVIKEKEILIKELRERLKKESKIS